MVVVVEQMIVGVDYILKNVQDVQNYFCEFDDVVMEGGCIVVGVVSEIWVIVDIVNQLVVVVEVFGQ